MTYEEIESKVDAGKYHSRIVPTKLLEDKKIPSLAECLKIYNKDRERLRRRFISDIASLEEANGFSMQQLELIWDFTHDDEIRYEIDGYTLFNFVSILRFLRKFEELAKEVKDE